MKWKYVLITAAAAGFFFAGRGCGKSCEKAAERAAERAAKRAAERGEIRTEVRVDTIFVRDTVRIAVAAAAVERIVTRVDTVWLPPGSPSPTTPKPEPGSGDSLRVALPIERRTYTTDDFRAVVEGFRPELKELEIYRNNLTISQQTTRTLSPAPPRRIGIGIQAGVGLVVQNGSPHLAPYLGVGVQYRLTVR